MFPTSLTLELQRLSCLSENSKSHSHGCGLSLSLKITTGYRQQSWDRLLIHLRWTSGFPSNSSVEAFRFLKSCLHTFSGEDAAMNGIARHSHGIMLWSFDWKPYVANIRSQPAAIHGASRPIPRSLLCFGFPGPPQISPCHGAIYLGAARQRRMRPGSCLVAAPGSPDQSRSLLRRRLEDLPRPHMQKTCKKHATHIPRIGGSLWFSHTSRYDQISSDIRQKLLSNQNMFSLLRSDLFKDCNWSRATRTFQQIQNSASGSLKYLNMPTGEKNNFPEWICNVRVHKLGCQYQFTLKIALFWHYTIHFAGEQFWAIPKWQLDWSREKKTWSDQREWANLISVFGRTVVQNHLQTLHRGHEGRLLLNAATPKPIQNHQNRPGTFGQVSKRMEKTGKIEKNQGKNRQIWQKQ